MNDDILQHHHATFPMGVAILLETKSAIFYFSPEGMANTIAT